MNKLVLLISIFIFSLISLVQAQTPKLSTTSKAAIRHFEDGTRFYDNGDMDRAEASLKHATEKDPNFIEAWTVLGELAAMQKDYEAATGYYEHAVDINPTFYPNNRYQLGRLHFITGEYTKAKNDFEAFSLMSSNSTADIKSRATNYQKSCEFAIDALAHPVPFNPENLGQGVNSPLNEYYPSLTLNQKEIVFTRDLPDSRSLGGHNEDFFISTYKDSVWQTARPAGAPLNSLLNEGAPTISADGRVLFYTGCNREDGKGSCDIYLSQRSTDGSWGKPINLGAPINTSAWESQPSFSSDGRTLYFIRGQYDRSRNIRQDIYSSTFNEDMTWSEPVKLNDTINSPEREESVFIHPDNQTLYFSSDGHSGMGGLDIFMSKRTESGSWGKPVNLGYPINTSNDENSLLVSADGLYAYFASNREGGMGGLDLYRFELPAASRASMVSYLRALVTDAATGAPLSAKFEIVDIETGKTIVANSTDKRRGEFLASLPAGKNYMLNVNKEGYLFYSDLFELKEAPDKQKAFELKIALQKPVAGEKVVLRNIFFDINRYELRKESAPELSRLVSFLKTNGAIRIEISGHTDSTGDKKLNLTLSDNRAKAVREELIRLGISSDRLTYKGYGDNKPVATNTTEEGRALNRRTEFTIL